MAEITPAQQEERTRFENEIGVSPWATEYQTRFGEKPNLYAPEYDLLNAWRNKVQPTRDPYDQNSLHWPSRLPDGTWLKAQDHPTAWKEQAMNATGVNPDAVGLTKEAWEASQAPSKRVTDALMLQSSEKAGQAWPRLTAYAPNVGQETMAHRPDTAGRFDPETRSVLLNNARTTPLTPEQATGLVGLERARGHLASPVGQSWTDRLPLPDDQRKFWDSYYLRPGVDAPTDQAARDRILKSTIMSRMLVGDTMPDGSPALTPEQEAMGALYSSYARGRK